MDVEALKTMGANQIVYGSVALLVTVLFVLGNINVRGVRTDWLSWLFTDKDGRDFLRTLATLGGFILAVLAYWHWRRPDDTKRRAETAQEIIRLSRKAEAALVASREAQAVFVFDGGGQGLEPTEAYMIDTMRRAVEGKNNEKVKEAHDVGLELLGFETEAVALFGRGSGARVRSLFEKSEAIELAYIIAPHFWNGFAFPDAARRAEVLQNTLRVLGIRKHMEGPGGRDQFEVEIVNAANELKEELVKFLVKKPLS